MATTETIAIYTNPDDVKRAAAMLRAMISGETQNKEIILNGSQEKACLRLVVSKKAPKSMGPSAVIEEVMNFQVQRDASWMSYDQIVTFGVSFYYADVHTAALVLLEAITDKKAAGLYLSVDTEAKTVRVIANSHLFLLHEPDMTSEPGYMTSTPNRYRRALVANYNSVELEVVPAGS